MPASGPTPDAEWFRSLRQPTGGSCCDLSDCHRIPEDESRQSGNEWWFKATHATWGGDGNESWILIPEDKFLRKKDNPTGFLIVCAMPGYLPIADAPAGAGVEKSLMVLCAIKPYGV